MSRSARLLRLAWIQLAATPRSAALSALGVAVGIACFLFFVALGRGVGRTVREKVFPADAARLEVVPPRVSLGFLGGGAFDAAAVERLRALSGVKAAYPKMAVRVPAVCRYDGMFFGAPLRMGIEIVGVGVDPRGVASDARDPKRAFADRAEGEPIPVLVSRRILDVYNGSFAAQRGLPRLSEEMLAGFVLPLEVGRSYVTPGAWNADFAEMKAEVVGFSDRVFLGGLTMPLETARRLNKRFGRDADTYSAVTLEAASPAEMPRVAQAVRAAGFDIDDAERRMAEQVGGGVALITAVLALLSFLITALAAVNIAHAMYASVRERRREIGILRAVGASGSDVASLVLIEAAILGGAGGAVGVLVGWAAAFGADVAARTALPPFPFKPESFFEFTPALFAGAVGVAVAAALAGAYFPARAAARLDPARALQG